MSAEEVPAGGTAREPAISDESITAAVRKAMLIRLSLQTHPISVNVQNGIVTLRGLVDSAETRYEAGRLAVMAPGVRDLVNLIEVSGEAA